MASVRASLVTQARVAAQRLDAASADHPAVDQLVRCARLSPDADRELDWALTALAAHSVDSHDRVACQLLRAARARLDHTDASRQRSARLAWR